VGKAVAVERVSDSIQRIRRGSGVGMPGRGDRPESGKPYMVAARDRQPDSGDGQAGPGRVADRFVVARKPGNAGRAKGP
jgi:hypothetical protein